MASIIQPEIKKLKKASHLEKGTFFFSDNASIVKNKKKKLTAYSISLLTIVFKRELCLKKMKKKEEKYVGTS